MGNAEKQCAVKADSSGRKRKQLLETCPLNRRPRVLLSGIQGLSLLYRVPGFGRAEDFMNPYKIRLRVSNKRRWIPDNSTRGRRVHGFVVIQKYFFHLPFTPHQF